MGDVYTLLCIRSAELSKAFVLRNLYYSTISVVMFLGYLAKTRVRTKKYALRPDAAYLNSQCHICLVQKI